MVRNSNSNRHRKPKPSKRHSHRWFRRRRTTSPSSPSNPSDEEDSNPSNEEDAIPFSSSEANPNSHEHSNTEENSVGSIYALTNYVPVAPLPVFRGDVGECPFMHISRFDRVCRANNVVSHDVAARIFPASLDSYAGIWYDLYIDPSDQPWEDIRSAFLSVFRPPGFISSARAELFSLRQLTDEGVNRYHLRMQWILTVYPEHGIRDDVLKEIFINGLKKELKEFVTPQRVQTLDEAVSLAAVWEQADGVREARRNAVRALKCEFCGVEGHEENACEVRKRLKGIIPVNVGNGGTLVAMERMERMESVRSVQCRCLRHQCSKKTERNVSRNASMRSRKSFMDSDYGT